MTAAPKFWHITRAVARATTRAALSFSIPPSTSTIDAAATEDADAPPTAMPRSAAARARAVIQAVADKSNGTTLRFRGHDPGRLGLGLLLRIDLVARDADGFGD